jgi:hypothetical protein
VSSTYSTTYSYTVTDIGKVFDNVRADFHMAAQSTRLWTDNFVDAVVDDLKRYALYSYIDIVAIYLLDSSGVAVRAATYRVSENAGGWTSDRPGNMLWPKGIGVSLRVTISLSAKWYGLSQQQQNDFMKGLKLPWPSTSKQDLSFPNLTSATDRRYASNGFGVQKSVFR